MTRIPSFQRQQLASSVVGTPGIDTSGADTMNALARLGGQVMESSFSIAAERQQVADISEAARLLVDYKLDSDNVLIDHKTKNAAQPVDSVPQLRQTLGDRLDAMVSNISSPTVRNMVIKNGQSVISSRLDEASIWAQKQLLVNTMNNVNTTIDGLAKQSYTIFGDQNADLTSKVTKLQEYLNEGAKTIPSASRALSPEQFEKFQKEVPKKIVSGALYGSMEKNPAEVLALIQSGQLNGLMDPEDIQKFEKDATAKVTNIQNQMEISMLVEGINGNVETWNKLQKNELTLAEIDAMPDSAFTQKIRDIHLKANPLTEQENYEQYADLFTEFAGIANKKGKAINKKTELNHILEFQQKVIEARERGVINESQANTFFEMTTPAVESRSKKLYAEGEGIIDIWLKGWRTKEQKKDKGRILAKYNSLFSDLKNRGVVDINAKELAQYAIRSYAQEENPSLGQLPETPNSIMTPNGDEKKILPGQSKIRVDGQAKRKGIIKMDPVTGVKARVYDDGSYDIIKE